jgi:hypothetical protein
MRTGIDVRVHVAQGVVTLDSRNVAIDVDLRGVFAQWQPFASDLWSQCFSMAEQAYLDGDRDREATMLEACAAIAPRWLRSHIALDAIDVWRAGEWSERQLVDAWSPTRAPLTERSRCGLHGDSTSSGRCATCDRLGVRL